jgi:predicted nuclease with TOPRIM domain
MDTSSKSKEYYIRQINDLTDDKAVLTGQLQASRNTSKNLDNECKDLLKEVNSLRQTVKELSDYIELESSKELCYSCNISWNPSLIESGQCVFCILKETKKELQEAKNNEIRALDILNNSISSGSIKIR